MATNSAWATISICPNATAPARRCNGRPNRMPASPKATRPCAPVIDKGAYSYEHVNAAKQRRDPNSMLNWTERHRPDAQGGTGDRLGRFQGDRDARSRGAGDPLRLAQQLGAVRAQSRRKAARSSFSVGLPGETGKLWSTC
jgi:maltose alpha-D-glucosyltransferase/alpha-amylase